VKRFLFPLCGAIVSFVVFNLFPFPRYFYHDLVVQAHEDENLLLAIIMFVEWPIYLLIGAFCGFLMTRLGRAKK